MKNRRPKIFYATQVAVAPPTFVFFAREAAAVHFSYRRYLENQLREKFGFDGTPIRLVFRERSATARDSRRPAKARSQRRVAGTGRPSGDAAAAANTGGTKPGGKSPGGARQSGGKGFAAKRVPKRPSR